MLLDGPYERFDEMSELFALIRFHLRTEVREATGTTKLSSLVEIRGQKALWDIVGLVRHLVEKYYHR